MVDTVTSGSAADSAPSIRDTEKETLIGGERIIAKFHPHPMAFVRWYLPSVLLFVWTGAYLLILAFFAWLFQDFRNLIRGSDIAPLLFWAIGAFLIGLIMPRDPRTAHKNVTAATFLKSVHYLYFVLLALPFILYFIFRAKAPAVELSPWVQVYALLVSVIMILLYDAYRRSFTYFITNFRVIFRYKFFKTAENNLRFSQMRDVEIDRSFLQRLFKLGNVRPYTGAEEDLVDLTPGYDSPDECFFGVRNPEYVKRLLLEQMLGPTDTIHAEQAAAASAPGGPAKPPGGAPSPPAAPAVAAAAAATSASAPSPDAVRVKRLEEELEQLRRERAGKPAGGTPPSAVSEVGKPSPPPPAKSARLSDVTPTVGVRETQKSHAEFGDDRDSFASSNEEFRGAKRPEKKPGSSGTQADEEDKPRGI